LEVNTTFVPGRDQQERTVWTLLGEGSAPPMSEKDDPAIVGIAAPIASKGEGTYKTLNK
jgi:hypothetical protein